LIDARRLEGQSFEGFVCISVTVIDPLARRLTLSAAGTEHPIVARGDGRMESIVADGIPLSIIEKFEYSDVVVDFGTGDTIAMFTDGVTEAHGKNGFFGTDGIQQALASAIEHHPINRVPQAILDAARKHADGSLGDDACIIVARRNN
jgi:serine phosphatase RsbU (regulator of sigma subunit)